MKRLAALGLVGVFAVAAMGQMPPVWTHPSTPATAALDRLNLRLGWRAGLPIQGFRDGIATIQNLGDVIIVQARNGSLTAFDPVTGAPKWYAQFGQSYPVTHRVGYNDLMILAANGTSIYALDRVTGSLLWSVDLTASPSSPPTADANTFYVCLSNGRLAAYAYPVPPPASATPPSSTGNQPATGTSKKPVTPPVANVTGATKTGGPRATPNTAQPTPSAGSVRVSVGGNAVSATVNRAATVTSGTDSRSAATAMNASTTRTATGGGQINRTGRGAAVANAPKLLWDMQTHMRVSERPIVTEKGIIVIGSGREAIFVGKNGDTPVPFKADANFSAPIAQFGDTVYAACVNGSIYAFHLPSRTVVWQVTANGPITAQPMATDEDLFVTVERNGLVRYLRANGQFVWQNPEAVQFIASNPKFVYALDRLGRLLVLDRLQGTTLTSMDVRDYVVNLENDESDRVILGANDGTVLSLNDREYLAPLKMRAPTRPPAPPVENVKPLEPVKPADADKDK